MFTRSIPNRYSEIQPEIAPENKRCENCLYWLADGHPVYATIAKRTIRVAQCGSEEEDAPSVGTDTSDAFAFTPANGSCDAFELHPEADVELVEHAAHYRALDDERTREAWTA